MSPATQRAVDELVAKAPPFTEQQEHTLQRIFAPAVAVATPETHAA